MKQRKDAEAWTENDENAGISSEQALGKDSGDMKHEEMSLPDAETAESDPLIKMEVELTEYKDKYLRLYSEFENFKKRTSRERGDTVRFAAMDIFLSLLPVIDDFERAQKSMEDTPDQDPGKQGIQLIFQKLKSVTERNGLKPMLSVGTTFDPELHDAITNIDAPSVDMKGKVVEELEKGYYLHDKVIRHAKVIVGK